MIVSYLKEYLNYISDHMMIAVHSSKDHVPVYSMTFPDFCENTKKKKQTEST